MVDHPSFESSDEMVRRARQELVAPTEGDTPMAPAESAAPDPRQTRRDPTPPRERTVRVVPRRVVQSARSVQIALAVVIALFAAGIAIFAAVAGGQ